jgi:arsenate reductase (thioredoxin)
MANVLFVCVQNAGRSQLAEAYFERAARGRHAARSAGSVPAERVHPNVAALLPELASRVPRKLERADAEWADVVVTMGCGDACPYIPGKRYVDWELEDPAGKDPETTRRIASEIERRVASLADELDRAAVA